MSYFAVLKILYLKLYFFIVSDLVDFDAESVTSNLSDDFVVVPTYFDINAPLDETLVRHHQLTCRESHSGHGTLQLAFTL